MTSVRIALASLAVTSALFFGCDVCRSQLECGVVGAPDASGVCGLPADAGYPSNPGFGINEVIADYTWTGRLSGISSPTTTLSLHDYYNPDCSKPLKYMFITVSAFWCQACKDEATHLNDMLAKYGPKGVIIVTDIAQRLDRSITTQTDVDAWIESFHLQTAVVTDPGFQLQAFFDPSTMPLDLIIDLRTMTVVYDTTGSVLPSVESFLDSKLD